MPSLQGSRLGITGPIPGHRGPLQGPSKVQERPFEYKVDRKRLVFIFRKGPIDYRGLSVSNFTPIARALAAPLIDQMNFNTQYVKMHVVQWRNFYFRL